jgi:DNA-binding transcriptional ArsR family regulator
VGTGGTGGQQPFVIKDAAGLKAVADPLRHHILTLLDTPKTVKELAEAIGRPPDRLYYHMGVLERAGLVKAADARGEERRYALVSQVMTMDPNLPIPPGAAGGMITGILERAQREYAQAIQHNKRGRKRRSMLGLTYHVLDEAQFRELCKRFEELVAEYEDANQTVNEPGGEAADEPTGDRKVFGVIRGAWQLDVPTPADEAKKRRR